jgi:thiol-disulfide isomerase/thioredoxin
MSTNHYELESEAQFNELTTTQGRTVVLNFWASWAPPCAHLNEVFKSLSKKFSGLTFISVSYILQYLTFAYSLY